MLFDFRLKLSRWWLTLPIGLLASAIVSTLLYLSAGYKALVLWYLGLFPCIYKHADWSTSFFTPAVKHAGNKYGLVGMVLAFILLIAAIRLFQRSKGFEFRICCRKVDVWYLVGLFLFGLCIWLYGFFVSYPAYDEVFSAVNCAGMHPFQTASYYMLPNNHIFFNTLNSLLFHFAGNMVLTGRFISGAAFAILIPLLYYWLKSITKSPVYAAIFCAVLMLQFPVWAFSFQARGYSIYLICSWASFILLQRYLKTQRTQDLFFHGLSIVIGFWTVPSFLFWEVSLIVYAVFAMLHRRKIEWTLVKTHFIVGCSVFLAFLPILCFSGEAAILENHYVNAVKVPLAQYWPGFSKVFQSSIQYCFSGFVDAQNWTYIFLFYFPLLALFFVRKTRAGGIVAFSVIVWLVLAGMTLQMQRFPFMRNLTAHCSVTLAAVLLAGHSLLHQVGKRRMIALKTAAITLFCLGMAVHFIRFNRDHIHDSIYFYDVKSRFISLHNAVLKLPENARVGLSDEGFYWEFLCKQRGLKASMCMDSMTHYIKIENEEKLPDYLRGHVEKILQVDEYEIYAVHQ